jgi:hypothetical protein
MAARSEAARYSTKYFSNLKKQKQVNLRAWIRDIDLRHTSFSPQHFMEYIQLWNALSHIELHTDREDNIVWKFNPNGKFTTGSAYHAQFIGATVTNFSCLIRKV